MKLKTKNNLKLFAIVLIFGWLTWSSYDLMKYSEQQPVQMGFALGYLTFLLIAIAKRIYSIKILVKERESNFKKMYSHFKFFTGLLYFVLGLYSAYIFILADRSIISTLFSSIWLLMLIFCFQSIPFLIFSYQLKGGLSEKIMLRTFLVTYAFLSIIFGWSSAYLAHDVLMIPIQQDLFIVSYGMLIFPIIFIIYFDKNYDYISVV